MSGNATAVTRGNMVVLRALARGTVVLRRLLHGARGGTMNLNREGQTGAQRSEPQTARPPGDVSRGPRWGWGRAGRRLLRTVAAALVIAPLAAGGATHATSANTTLTYAVGVNPCASPQTQLCTPIPTVGVPTDGALQVEFVASPDHCSDVIAHLLVDGVEKYHSAPLAPGASIGIQDLGPVSPGTHRVGVQAEGVTGGCNTGYLAIWRGTLSVTVSGLAQASTTLVNPGQTASVSTVALGSPAPAGVQATYTRSTTATDAATLTAATYAGAPVAGPEPPPIRPEAFVDLLLLGGGTGDTLSANFVPPDPIFPPDPIVPPDPILPPDAVRLVYWDGATWSPVRTSAGSYPIYQAATKSFAVGFGGASAPQITALGGTVFAFIPRYAAFSFQSPVSSDAMNVAKAGRAIPLKWRLLDLGNNPVTNLAPEAVKVTSVAVGCAGLSQATDPVSEYAVGASGLQNLGDGYYQFNWATDQAYAGSCRQLRLDLGERLEDGTTPIYHTADFQFTR